MKKFYSSKTLLKLAGGGASPTPLSRPATSRDDLYYFAFPISVALGLLTSGLRHHPISVFTTRALFKMCSHKMRCDFSYVR